GSGLYVSRDGGDSWKRLEGKGLPDGIWGRVGVQVAESEPKRVYALIEAEEGGLFRSDNAGKKWTRISASRGVRQRAWYYTTLTIDPANADVVWFPQVSMLKTTDGGKSIRAVKGGGWDYHDVWIDPQNTKRIIVGSDAGVSLSSDGGETWFRPALPIAQFYHLSVDTSTPYRVMGSLQDFGTASGPSNSLHGGGILSSDWHKVGGGEAGHVPIPTSSGPVSTSASSRVMTGAPARRRTSASTPKTGRAMGRSTSDTAFSGRPRSRSRPTTRRSSTTPPTCSSKPRTAARAGRRSAPI
ncbi:MAG: hypothetical protein IFK91_10570, partial [Acidobacteria bacterium]|nr:hypothetical protein [Candidatus Sulfomarinibacter sp. MAG AM1]